MKPIFEGEYVTRTTIEKGMMEDPERLLTYMTVVSLKAYYEAQTRHYNGYGVSAVAPVYDIDDNPKMLTASNYRPEPEKSQTDIRVCAEQALFDNAVHEGDLSLGVLLVRGPKPDPEKPIVGCRPEMKTLHLCRPCRGRVLEIVAPELLIVTFVDDEPEPTEALTLGQMLGYHDANMNYPKLPRGKSARDVTLDALTKIPELWRLSRPKKPRRHITAAERNR